MSRVSVALRAATRYVALHLDAFSVADSRFSRRSRSAHWDRLAGVVGVPRTTSRTAFTIALLSEIVALGHVANWALVIASRAAGRELHPR